MTGICLPIDAVEGVPSFPAAQHRVALGALMGAEPGRPLGARSGIRPGAKPTVTVTATQWTVTPFSFVADPSTSGTVGPYVGAFLNTEIGNINAADPSLTRYDWLCVQVPDDPPGADPRSARIVYTPGVPGTGHGEPFPPRSFPLGYITVPKVGGGAPSFVEAWPYVAGPGGIVPVRGATEYPAAPHIGQYVDDNTAGGLLRWDGAKWSPVTPPTPVARVKVSAGFTLPQNGWTQVTRTSGGASCFTVDYDPLGLWSDASSVFYLMSHPGVWRVTGRLSFAAASTGIRGVGIAFSTATVDNDRSVLVPSTSPGGGLEVNTEIRVPNASNQYVRLMAYQSAVASMTLYPFGEFLVEYVRPL